jgi:metal-responsive CopG/Arc/MetJ family transcriptional regulator
MPPARQRIPMQRILLPIPQQYLDQLDAIADRDGKTRTQLIRDAILMALKADKRNNP